MKAFRSIRWRLQLWYGALFAVVLAGLGAVAYEREAEARLERIDSELERGAFVLNGVARRRGPPPPRKGSAGPQETSVARPVRSTQTLADALSAADVARGTYFALWRKNEEPRFTASVGAPADIPRPSEREEQGVRQRGMWREAFLAPNPGDIALVGRSIAPEMAELHRFGWLLIGGGVAVFALVMSIGYWLVTRALRPIQYISAAAGRIASGDLTQRIDARDTESELGVLAGVLNATFARLEASFAQQARFTADAAHELRTPVTVILTHVQNGLADGGLTPEHREAFDACQRAAQRMRRMIESLLLLSRLDAGQESLADEVVDLVAVAREGLDMVGPLAMAHRVDLNADLAAAECRGDSALLAQVVTNLLANAIHHGREGGEVRVATRADDEAVYFTVRDNGPGIAAEHVPHIFKRFYRADRARTSTAGRTGLGLAITKAIVEAHNGTIGVESREGEGAEFTVCVPRR